MLIFKKSHIQVVLCMLAISLLTSCGFYSLTGAAISGDTINIHFIENKAPTVAPSLSATFTQKLRQHLTSLSSLAQVDNDKTDYDIKGSITTYNVTVASITGTETSAKNRLTIGVSITFEDRKDKEKNFTQTFSRFADFDASQNFQSVESSLIETITDELKDDIFNRAFVNW